MPNQAGQVLSEEQYRNKLIRSKRLSKLEIKELIDFQFQKPAPVSIDAQARFHYLRYKLRNPKKAKILKAEMDLVVEKAKKIHDEVIIVRNFCLTLYKYVKDFIFRYLGRSYKVCDNKLRMCA
jgi:hypothetical protein